MLPEVFQNDLEAALVQLMVQLSFDSLASSSRPKKTVTFDWVAPSF